MGRSRVGDPGQPGHQEGSGSLGMREAPGFHCHPEGSCAAYGCTGMCKVTPLRGHSSHLAHVCRCLFINHSSILQMFGCQALFWVLEIDGAVKALSWWGLK